MHISVRLLFFLLLIGKPLMSQPLTPVVSLKKLGQWLPAGSQDVQGQRFSSLWGWTAADGKEYAIIGGTDSVYFVDVSVPESPKLCDAEFGGAKFCTNREFKTYSHYCYAAADRCDNPKLQIFDLQYLPDSVHKVYEADTVSGKGHNLFVDHDRLYVASNGFMVSVGSIRVRELHAMSVLSLADPEKPVILGHVDGFNGSQTRFSEIHDVYVRHDTAYCSAGTDGLFIYDLRSVPAPVLIQSIEPPYPQSGYNHSSWLSPDGNLMVFADETHGTELKLVNMSDFRSGKDHPNYFFLSTFGEKASAGAIPHNAFLKDSLAYVSYYQEGVVVFDVRKPKDPVKLAQYDTYPQDDTIKDATKRYAGFQGCWNVYPFFSSGVVIASDMTNGLFTLRLDTTLGIGSRPQPLAALHLLNTMWYEDINLETAFEASTRLSFQLTDMAGRTLWTEQRYAPQGHSRLRLQPESVIANGWYLLSVRNAAGESRSFRLLRQR